MTPSALPGPPAIGDNDAVSRGFSLVETMLVLAVAGLAAAAGARGAGALADALRVEAARAVVTDALLEGRRLAYLGETTVTVRVPETASFVEIGSPHRRVELPRGVRIAQAPTDEGVDFRASSLADNATVVLRGSGASATIVVNQRGVIR